VETPEAIGASQGDRRGGSRRRGSTGISDAEARSRETGCSGQLIAGRNTRHFPKFWKKTKEKQGNHVRRVHQRCGAANDILRKVHRLKPIQT
jgi:hypothetical protein